MQKLTVGIRGKFIIGFDGEEQGLLYVDEEKLVRDVQEAGERIWSRIPEVHHFKKAADEVSPQSFRPWEE